ncbi:hypothetical protein ACFW16_28385 [Inquilinus sp. NPDC058860]|uniref:hypothetical protein n=1 Tax=Inquilinus sp. NPDC058860 TaxID=3346652 RepID=UPI0036B3C56A
MVGDNHHFTTADILVLDNAIASIQRNPGMYLGAETGPIGPILAGKLASSLIHDLAVPLTISVTGEWWILSSNVDWLGKDYLARGLFSRIVPDPRGGPNGYRQEILLAAFARLLVVADAAEVVWLKGDPEIEALPMEAVQLRRLGARTIAYLAA